MAIIYSTISEEVSRKGFDKDFIETLLKLYQPNDRNKEKENLLTICLNNVAFNKNNIEYLIEKFLPLGFLLEINKVKAPQWGFILKYFIDKGYLDELPQYIAKKRFPAYDLLMLPTSFRLQVFKHFHKKDNKYITAKYNLLDDIFSYGELPVNKQNTPIYLNDMKEILKILVKDQCFNMSDIDKLLDDKIAFNFYRQYLLQEYTVDAKTINAILSNTNIKVVLKNTGNDFSQLGKELLYTWVTELKTEYLSATLNNKDIKKPQRNKI